MRYTHTTTYTNAQCNRAMAGGLGGPHVALLFINLSVTLSSSWWYAENYEWARTDTIISVWVINVFLLPLTSIQNQQIVLTRLVLGAQLHLNTVYPQRVKSQDSLSPLFVIITWIKSPRTFQCQEELCDACAVIIFVQSFMDIIVF